MLKPVLSVPQSRLAAFDGLRGVAAAIVVAYHYIYLLHWQFLPGLGRTVPSLSDTPLGILWNGPFAVSVFFVLSGFVMAAAAERRRNLLIANVLTRYLRLAVPVTASVVLAWVWLNLFPRATSIMRENSDFPSPWLRYTYHIDIPGFHYAIADGLVANFLRGYSYFNNVLWTMQIEFFGSILIFVLYKIFIGRVRIWTLLLAGGVSVYLTSHTYYLAFMAGSLLYEARRSDLIALTPAWLGPVALVFGLLLGAPGQGFGERVGFLHGPAMLQPGHREGLWPVLAAACLLFAALRSRSLQALLSMKFPQWLGRISFGLYLVHVPPLYTLVAAVHLSTELPELVIGIAYVTLILLLAHVFTALVDEPTLHGLRKLRSRSEGLWRREGVLPTVMRR